MIFESIRGNANANVKAVVNKGGCTNKELRYRKAKGGGGENSVPRFA
ncbi:MAG: hypothetical protein ACWGOX_15915 [Desulforhopalus sp.]